MLLQEPPHTRYDLHFPLAGVPVRVHPMFWLVAFFMSVRDGLQHVQLQPLVISMGVLFVSILVHEFGHALAYRWYRYEPRIVLHWLGGLATVDMTYSVSPPRGKRQMIVCLAGPIAGFVLAALTVAVLFAIGRQVEFLGLTIGRGQPFAGTQSGYNLATLFYSLLFVNVLWGLINLLPVFPLDGGQIAREAYQMRAGPAGVLTALKLSMVVGILAAWAFWRGSASKRGCFRPCCLARWPTETIVRLSFWHNMANMAMTTRAKVGDADAMIENGDFTQPSGRQHPRAPPRGAVGGE